MDLVTYAVLKKKITSALTGIANITADENGRLVFETNDGATFTINIPGGALPESFTVTNGVGKAEKGTEYVAGTAIADIVVDMLSVYAPPSIEITTNLSSNVLDVESTLSTINITSKVTKGSKDIESVTVYINNNVVKTYTGDTLVENGTYVTSYTFSPATNESFTIKVTVNDGDENTTKTNIVTFIGKSYWGSVGDISTTPTEAEILALQNNTVKASRTLAFSNIVVEYGKVMYAYPKTLGALTKIVDEDNRNYTESYDMFTVTVKGIEYYCYRLKDSMGTDGAYQKYT